MDKVKVSCNLEVIRSIAATIGVIIFAAFFLTFVLYLVERGDPVTKYFSYYGNVTSKAVYEYPQRIHSYTFGTTDQKSLDLYFTNSLWCTPEGKYESPSLIATRSGLVTDFTFTNVLPKEVLGTAIVYGQPFSRFGIFDEHIIREADRQYHYKTWTMGSFHPKTTSICYLDSIVIGHTTVLKLEKTIHFRSSQFTYKVPEGVYDAEGNLTVGYRHPLHKPIAFIDQE